MRVKSWHIMRLDSVGGPDKVLVSTAASSMVSAASGWGFNSNHGGNPSTAGADPRASTAYWHTSEHGRKKQISISQYSLPPPASCLLTQPPKCCHVCLTSSQNKRDNSDHDGERLHWLLRGCFQGWGAEYSHFWSAEFGWRGIKLRSGSISPKLWYYSLSYSSCRICGLGGDKLSRGRSLSYRCLVFVVC